MSPLAKISTHASTSDLPLSYDIAWSVIGVIAVVQLLIMAAVAFFLIRWLLRRKNSPNVPTQHNQHGNNNSSEHMHRLDTN